jgi:hypothetical protein
MASSIQLFNYEENLKVNLQGRKTMKSIYWVIIFVGIFLFLPAHSIIANITNPSFADEDSDGIIDGWTHSDFVWAYTTGSVQFAPDPDRQQKDSYLWQAFPLDPGSEILSFSGNISVPNETGIFTAALLDPEGGHLAGFPDPFFTISSEDIPSDEDNLDFTCSLDVSGLSGQQVKLVFNLNNDYLSANDSYVVLSNLGVSTNVQVIPVPGAVALGGIGVTLVGWLRRRRIL